mgnify:CR=1 FL=1
MITHDGQHAEEVAYGPQIMMDRLRKWLDRYFAMLTTPATVAGQCEDAIELLGKYKDLCEEIKRGDSYHLGRIDAAISVLAQAAPQPAVQALEDTDALSMSRALFLQREADAKDAARWRCLRAMHWSESELCVVLKPKKFVKLGAYCPSLAELDKFIDDIRAARALLEGVAQAAQPEGGAK